MVIYMDESDLDEYMANALMGGIFFIPLTILMSGEVFQSIIGYFLTAIVFYPIFRLLGWIGNLL